MSEKRFSLSNPITHNPIPSWIVIVHDDKEHKHLNAEAIVDLLNEQQATIHKLQDFVGQSDYENAKLRQEIKELKAQLREKEEDERLYANEIVKLNKEAKEVLDFKNLGGDY